MLAVIDGLGHGPIAAEAAQAAIAVLTAEALERPVLDTMKTLHDKLRGTRGVAATLCVIRGKQVEGCAVGNVQLSSANADIPLVLSQGVLGMRVQKFHVCQRVAQENARIALFSDGISSRVALPGRSQAAARGRLQAIFEQFRKKEDDATILIADMDG